MDEKRGVIAKESCPRASAAIPSRWERRRRMCMNFCVFSRRRPDLPSLAVEQIVDGRLSKGSRDVGHVALHEHKFQAMLCREKRSRRILITGITCEMPVRAMYSSRSSVFPATARAIRSAALRVRFVPSKTSTRIARSTLSRRDAPSARRACLSRTRRESDP